MWRGTLSAVRVGKKSLLGAASRRALVFRRPLSSSAHQRVLLNYQTPPPPEKFTGRYINQPDQGDCEDKAEAREVKMYDARSITPPATVNAVGFELKPWPTRVENFHDDKEVLDTYYEEIMGLVKESTGAARVFVFDHTLRETGSTNLNAAQGGKASPVARVHCDYTATGAPKRLTQLGKAGIYSRVRGRTLTAEEVEELGEGRFAFVNVWRSICDESPIQQQPLAVCDERSVPDSDRFLYQLRFPDRTGENYSLQFSEEHKWYYYPKMTKDECLVFKVYDKQETGPRFVFHTAFSDPSSPTDAPSRKSIEVRTIAFFPKDSDSSSDAGDGHAVPSVGLQQESAAHGATTTTPTFFDMVHSNNAARVRLWLHLKGDIKESLKSHMVKYDDLQQDWFSNVNPLKKVPAFIRGDGVTVFESAVILSFLEDKYADAGPMFKPSTPEGRQLMELMIRIHDLYIASPNCTAPGFSHSQGAMYLSSEWHGAARGMDPATRAAKIKELWQQLSWLEASLVGPHLVGDDVSLADFTWFPTCVFMEFMLPKFFDWPEVFCEGSPLPKIAAWYTTLCQQPAFAQTRQEIWGYWEEMEKAGQFKPIEHTVATESTYKWRYP